MNFSTASLSYCHKRERERKAFHNVCLLFKIRSENNFPNPWKVLVVCCAFLFYPDVSAHSQITTYRHLCSSAALPIQIGRKCASISGTSSGTKRMILFKAESSLEETNLQILTSIWWTLSCHLQGTHFYCFQQRVIFFSLSHSVGITISWYLCPHLR